MPSDSKTFCILPWIHTNLSPNGNVYPCCMSLQQAPVGNLNQHPMKSIFNNDRMKQIRLNMLSGTQSRECIRCYGLEKRGSPSDRIRSNKRFKQYFDYVQDTEADGTVPYRIRYVNWNTSNLCNLRCRSCGPTLSSNWYEDYIAMDNNVPEHPKIMKVDALDQILEVADDVDEFYFAGGEPLMIEANYILLEELIRRKRSNARLRYNTNLTQLFYKNKSILDLWNHFDHVEVGASLDAMGPRAELMRKGTKWNDVVKNRLLLKAQSPHVKFSIACTLGLLNSLHAVDFHKEWVDQRFIDVNGFGLNLLQSPSWQRLDVLPKNLKQAVTTRYQEHIDWIESHGGNVDAWQTAIEFVNHTDNSKHLPLFLERTEKLDQLRSEDTFSVFPELTSLRNSV